MAFLDSIASSDARAIDIAEAVGVTHPEMAPGWQRWIMDSAREQNIAHLKADKFSTYSASEDNVAELFKQTLTHSLAASPIDPACVDAVMLCTESFWDEPDGFSENPSRHFALRNKLLGTLSEVGLVNAVPYGNWLSACANFGTSLALAAALTDSGQHQTVIVALADRLHYRTPRLMHNGAAVISDLASSCIVRRDPGPLEVRHIINMAVPKIATLDNEDKADLGKLIYETLKAMKRLSAKFRDITGREVNDFPMFIANNFHHASLQVLTDSLRIPPDRVIRASRTQIGHSHASDVLLSVKMMLDAGELEPGADIVLFCTGVWAWSLVVLRRSDFQPSATIQ